MKRVRAGNLYQYHPVGYDIWDARTETAPGETVKVVNLPGCPRAGTMGHCHIQTLDESGKWTFAGLVLLASLQPIKKGRTQ